MEKRFLVKDVSSGNYLAEGVLGSMYLSNVPHKFIRFVTYDLAVEAIKQFDNMPGSMFAIEGIFVKGETNH